MDSDAGNIQAFLPDSGEQFLDVARAPAVEPIEAKGKSEPVPAWREGRVIALGSPGGSTIPTVTAQVLLNVIVDEDHLQAAVDRPRPGF